MRYLIPALALLLCQEAAAQLFKCTDAAGKITYSGTKCSDLGLKDVGEVKDRLNTSPAYQPPPGSTQSSPPPAAPSAPAAAAAPSEPEQRRCFTTTVKGKSVTRCNDKPDEPQ